jgi:hypothetical protein
LIKNRYKTPQLTLYWWWKTESFFLRLGPTPRYSLSTLFFNI